jgi:hypothetical protein
LRAAAAIVADQTLAVRPPFAAGLKLAVIKQLAPEAKLVPQVRVWAKYPALAPVMEMLVMLTATLAFVAHPNLLGKALGTNRLVAEIQAGRPQLNVKSRCP